MSCHYYQGGNSMNNKDRKVRHGLINYETGEVVADYNISESDGLRVVSNKTSKAHVKRKDTKDLLVKYGDYIHLRYIYQTPIFQELVKEVGHTKANTHIIRLIKLASLLTWNNTLYDSNRNRVKKSSLGKIWGITNRAEIKGTYDILTKYNYIYMEGDYIMINKDVISKGTIEADKDNTYTRIFIATIQELYDNSDKKKQKQIAHLFKILPYIHFEYNILCWNPTELDTEKIELMTWKDLASICGVSPNNVKKLKQDLSLKINNQYVIGEFKHSPTAKLPKIVVNPALYYAGSDIDKLTGVIKLFEAGNSK